MNLWRYSPRSPFFATVAISASVVACSGCQKATTTPGSADKGAGIASISNEGLIVTVPEETKDSVEVKTAQDPLEQSNGLSDTSRKWMTFGKTTHQITLNKDKKPRMGHCTLKRPSTKHLAKNAFRCSTQ